jgi:putative transposase
MTYQVDCSQFDLAMELLITNGFANVADVVGILMNSAMQIERSRHLQAIPYERTEERRGYANGFKPKTLKTRFGEVQLSVPQTRNSSFYPQSLERGQRSERALKLLKSFKKEALGS